jgi:hypothetical protein
MKFREISCDGVDSVQLTQCSQMMNFSDQGNELLFATKGRFSLNHWKGFHLPVTLLSTDLI